MHINPGPGYNHSATCMFDQLETLLTDETFAKPLYLYPLFFISQQEQYWRIPSTLSLSALSDRISFLKRINEESVSSNDVPMTSSSSSSSQSEVTSAKRTAVDSEESPAIAKRRRIVVSDSSDDDVDHNKQNAAEEQMEEMTTATRPTGRNRRTIVDSDSEWVADELHSRTCTCRLNARKSSNFLNTHVLNWIRASLVNFLFLNCIGNRNRCIGSISISLINSFIRHACACFSVSLVNYKKTFAQPDNDQLEPNFWFQPQRYFRFPTVLFPVKKTVSEPTAATIVLFLLFRISS